MDTERDNLERMLIERGVEGAPALVSGLADDEIDAALGAIAWWDDMPHTGPRAVGSGLLVKKIRDGGLPGYKRPHDRATPEGGTAVSDDRLRAMRGVLCSPDAHFTRETAAEFYAKTAGKLNTPVSALIDAAMGQEWVETPPHPASLRGWQIAGWKYPDKENAAARYALWCSLEGKMPKTRDGRRLAGETDWDFACRFWSWFDHEAEFQAALKKAAEHERRFAELRAQQEAHDEAQKRAEIQRKEAQSAEEEAARAQTVPADDGEDW